MPAGDRTGPWGVGPRIGRALGYCSGFRAPGFMVPGPGPGFGRGLGFGRDFGRGMGFGRGRGFRARWFNPYRVYPYPPSREEEEVTIVEQELQFLNAEAEQIRNELKTIEDRIKELKREDK